MEYREKARNRKFVMQAHLSAEASKDPRVYAFLVNPRAGNGKALRVWRRIEPMLKAQQVHYLVEFSESAAHASAWAREIVELRRDTPTVLAVVGGDGTLQSVAGVLAGQHRVALGAIPAGSGNDFARAIGMPSQPEEALRALLEGQEMRMDLIRIGGRCCLTVVGVGLDGAVAQAVNGTRAKKWLNAVRLGGLVYVLALFRALLRYRKTGVTLAVDGREHAFSDVWLTAAGNLPFYGGGMRICPAASGTDGQLEICVVHGISRMKFVRLFAKVYPGEHVRYPFVSLLRGREVEIRAERALPANGDGEVIGSTPLRLTTLPGAVTVIGRRS
jgi:lipid kinase, YegS/Rv2252/BmrU family